MHAVVDFRYTLHAVLYLLMLIIIVSLIPANDIHTYLMDAVLYTYVYKESQTNQSHIYVLYVTFPTNFRNFDVYLNLPYLSPYINFVYQDYNVQKYDTMICLLLITVY